MKLERTKDVDDVQEAWLLYLEVFLEVNTLAAQRHVMFWEEFLEVMRDPMVIKYFVRNDAGEIVGLSVLTNHLRSWPLVAPEYFARKYPDYYERDAIWYCGFVGVKPHARHAFVMLVNAMLEDIHSNKGMTVMDFCAYNSIQKNLPHISDQVIKRSFPEAVSAKIDQQEFWAWRFDGKAP